MGFAIIVENGEVIIGEEIIGGEIIVVVIVVVVKVLLLSNALLAIMFDPNNIILVSGNSVVSLTGLPGLVASGVSVNVDFEIPVVPANNTGPGHDVE